MQPGEMTQQRATERAWRAACEAEGKAHLGDATAAHALAAVSGAWARVASQLPVELDASVPLFERLPEAHPTEPRVAVPTPRPLREHEIEQINVLRANGHLTDAELREQHAAGEALLGVDPLDPRTPVDDLDVTAVLAVKAHEPIDDAHDPGVCSGCTQPIVWRGGVWIDVTGGALCRTQSR